MTKQQIEKIIIKLSDSKYPLFTHEDDFRSKFILMLNKLYNRNQNLFFVSEYPYLDRQKVDLIIFDTIKKHYTAIEFKYVRQSGYINIPGNDKLKLAKAAGKKRIKHCEDDIERLKKLNLNNKWLIDKCRQNSYKKESCFFILLTNHGALLVKRKNEYKDYPKTDFKYLIKEI